MAWTDALGLIVVFASLALLAYLLYAKLPPVFPVSRAMPFLQHAGELRNRMIRVLVLLLFWTFLLLTLRFERAQLGPVPLPRPVPDLYDNAAARLYAELASLLVPADTQVIVTGPTEALGAQFQIALLVAILLTLPFLAFEVWAFFAPGLRPREERFLVRTFPAGLVLFLLGAAFGVYAVAPLLFQVLYAFAAPLGAVAFLSVGALIGTATTLALVFGLAFELPLIMVALARFGLVHPRSYLRYWRHATLGIFVVAALATADPTMISTLLIGGILLALYWGGALASHLVAPAPAVAHRGSQARTS